MKSPELVLLCTGLGRENRGFEQYISALAQKLSELPEMQDRFEVWSGGNWEMPGVRAKQIKSISRRTWPATVARNPFVAEQQSFMLSLLPRLIGNKPKTLYLGEFRLYAYLYKLRQKLNLNYRLILYTGGQAVPGPGLFNPERDYLHHITDYYLDETAWMPSQSQTVLPHFVNNDFEYNATEREGIREMAGTKKVVLSVGLIDKTVKRIDRLIDALILKKESFFPVILGQATEESNEIQNRLIKYFGQEGFVMKEVRHKELGNYYSAADVYVSCSPKESFGLAMVEAMYHGLPVITAEFPEVKYVLQEQAVYAEVDNPELLLNAIEQAIIQDSRHSRISRQQFIRARYSWEVLKEKYIGLFQPTTG